MNANLSLNVETVPPTQEEIEAMVASYGNLPESDYAHPMRVHGPDPLQGFEIDFSGLSHKPTGYTLDLMQDVLWMERGLFFDDVEYLAEGRIPIPDNMLVVFQGDLVLGAPVGQVKYDTKILRINFAKSEGENQAYADIIHVHADNVKSAIPMLELTLPIESIEVVNGMLTSNEEAVDG